MTKVEKASPLNADQRPFWWVLIFTIALMVRIVHLIQMNAAPFFGSKIGDAESYDRWARQIAAGDWIGTEVFYQAPLYPYFLASIYATLGDAMGTVLKIQAILGSISCVLLASAAWRLFSRPAGIASGLLAAFYAPAIFFEGLLQKSALDMFLLATIVWQLSLVIDAPTRRRWWWVGVTLGALILVRENALVFAPLLLFWVCAGQAGQWARTDSTRSGSSDSGWISRVWCRLEPRRFVMAGCFLVGLMVVLLPVAVRNKIVGGEFHLTTSQLGPNLYIGNNPDANGRYRPLYFGRGHARYEQDDARRLAESAVGHPLTPAEVSAYYVDQVREYVLSQPLDWIQLMLHKAALMVNAVELIDTEDQYTYAEWSGGLWLTGLVGNFGILFPLGLLGCVVSWKDRERLWILYAMLLIYAASVVGFYVFGRYRYPLVPLLIPFAGAGLVYLLECGRALRWDALRLGGVLFLAALLLSHLPLVSVPRMQAVTHNNLGNALARQGRFDEAEPFYRRALRIRPDYALAHNNLGVTLLHLARHREAAIHCEQALQLVPDYRNAEKNLARARAQIASP